MPFSKRHGRLATGLTKVVMPSKTRLTQSSFGLFAFVILVALSFCSLASAEEGEVEWIYGSQSPSVADSPRPTNSMISPIKKVGGSLAVVLGGFFLLTTLLRKKTNALPAHEMIETLGSVPITPKVRLHLVRFGARILVLHISGQNVQRVAELEEPAEVQKLLGLCDGKKNGFESSAGPVSVNDLLQTMESEPHLAMRGQR